MTRRPHITALVIHVPHIPLLQGYGSVHQRIREYAQRATLAIPLINISSSLASARSKLGVIAEEEMDRIDTLLCVKFCSQTSLQGAQTEMIAIAVDSALRTCPVGAPTE